MNDNLYINPENILKIESEYNKQNRKHFGKVTIQSGEEYISELEFQSFMAHVQTITR